LWGINNQNFIMRDEQTGSWWQQVTGEAIQGPLKGRRLAPVLHDEVSFGIWKGERPGGRVLRADPKRKDDYESADWERQMKRVRTVTPVKSSDPLAPRSTDTHAQKIRASLMSAHARLHEQMHRHGIAHHE